MNNHKSLTNNNINKHTTNQSHNNIFKHHPLHNNNPKIHLLILLILKQRNNLKYPHSQGQYLANPIRINRNQTKKYLLNKNKNHINNKHYLHVSFKITNNRVGYYSHQHLSYITIITINICQSRIKIIKNNKINQLK